MPKLPSLGGQAAVRAFEKAGFRVDRVHGSHHIMLKEGHRYLLAVPVHRGKTVRKETLHGLIKKSGLTVEEFIDLLD